MHLGVVPLALSLLRCALASAYPQGAAQPADANGAHIDGGGGNKGNTLNALTLLTGIGLSGAGAGALWWAGRMRKQLLATQDSLQKRLDEVAQELQSVKVQQKTQSGAIEDHAGQLEVLEQDRSTLLRQVWAVDEQINALATSIARRLTTTWLEADDALRQAIEVDAPAGECIKEEMLLWLDRSPVSIFSQHVFNAPESSLSLILPFLLDDGFLLMLFRLPTCFASSF
jgi:hypothetical protein